MSEGIIFLLLCEPLLRYLTKKCASYLILNNVLVNIIVFFREVNVVWPEELKIYAALSLVDAVPAACASE